MMGAKGKVPEHDGSFDRSFWRHATPEERAAAIFELRAFNHEVMHHGSGAKRLDRICWRHSTIMELDTSLSMKSRFHDDIFWRERMV